MEHKVILIIEKTGFWYEWVCKDINVIGNDLLLKGDEEINKILNETAKKVEDYMNNRYKSTNINK